MKSKNLQMYHYQGPVMIFNTCVMSSWSAETMAVSPAKAKSNLIYRYKRDNNLAENAKITLPGKLTEVN